MYIYRLYCTENNRSYIGSAGSLKHREQQHRMALKHKRHPSPALQEDYNEFGPASFICCLLEEVSDRAIAQDREEFWMRQFRSREDGYNKNRASNRVVRKEPPGTAKGMRRDPHDTPFSSFIRRRRSQLKMTQRQLADALGLTSPEAVGMFEAGKRSPDLDRMPALAEALQCDPVELGRLALHERHPLLYASLFGAEPPKQKPAVK